MSTAPPLSPNTAALVAGWPTCGVRPRGGGAAAIYTKSVLGGSEEMLLQSGPNGRATSDWTRDDRWLVYTENDPKTGADIWLLADPSETRRRAQAGGLAAYAGDGVAGPDLARRTMARLLVGRVRPVPDLPTALYRRGPDGRNEVGGLRMSQVASRAGAGTAKSCSG